MNTTIDLDTTIDLATPFAVVALPSSTLVDDDDIEVAHAALLDMYPEASPLRTRIENALLRVQQRHTWIFTEGVIQIGDQRVKLSKDQQEYICSCPDWTWKRNEHHGVCTHVCACEHVRLAQAACTASIVVCSPMLTHALRACCATGAADVRVQYDEALGRRYLHATTSDVRVEPSGTAQRDGTVDVAPLPRALQLRTLCHPHGS
jgi:hypothetical protein